jgi:hypothetical protein
MRARISLLRSAAVAAPVVLATVLAPAAASAVSTAVPAGWHISKTFASGSTISSVAGVSHDDAWLAGQTPDFSLLVQHWNGSKWQGVRTPAGLTSLNGAVIAGSPTGTVWAFANVSASSTYSVALRRTGNGWKSYQFASWSNINAAVVFSAKNAWAFGELFGTTSAPYVRHFNGTRWSGVATPVEPNDASAVSAGDIWVVGQTAKSLDSAHQVFAAAQWAHGAWHQRSLPRLGLPKGVSVFDPHVVALGPANVWVDFALSKGMGAYPGAVLLHYNGKKWARVTVPYAATFMLANLTSDGNGGIWVAATTNDGLDQDMYHLHAGHWSRALMPSHKGDTTQVLGVALRPGTTSVWAAGDMVPTPGGGTPQGVLLEYRS